MRRNLEISPESSRSDRLHGQELNNRKDQYIMLKKICTQKQIWQKNVSHGKGKLLNAEKA